MKILHLSSALSWRGGEQQIAWLYRELKQAGVDQWLATVKDSELAEWCVTQKIPHLTYTKGASINPLPGRTIARFCREQQIDLLHIHDSHAHTFAITAATLWGCRVPMVLSRRVDFPISNHFFSRWKYNHSAIRCILCVSDYVRKVLQVAIQQPERLVLVPDGVDLQRFSHRKEGKLHRKLALSTERILLGNVAAIAPHKDYFTFVDTIALLQEAQFPAHYLIIGGDGGEEVAIREYIEQKQLPEPIHFLGFRSDIPAILPELDMLLFTSKTEGLGSTLLDAFACRVPVVATAAGGIPEIVQEEQTGLLAKVQTPEALANQVQRLWQEEGLRKKIVEGAFDFVQAYSCAAMAAKTLEWYRKTIAEG